MRKTLLVLGTAAILCAALFRVEFVAQEPTREPATASPDVATNSADTVGGSRDSSQLGLFQMEMHDQNIWRIRSRVELPNGEPAKNIKVFYAQGQRFNTAITDDNGYFITSEVRQIGGYWYPFSVSGAFPVTERPGWQWTLPVMRVGGFSAAEDLLNQPPEKFIFRLEKAVKISGKITFEDGDPLIAEPAAAEMPPQNVGFTRPFGEGIDCGFNLGIDESGRYVFYLLPGEYRLSLRHAPWIRANITVSQDQNDVEVDDLQSPAARQILLVDESGQPISNERMIVVSVIPDISVNERGGSRYRSTGNTSENGITYFYGSPVFDILGYQNFTKNEAAFAVLHHPGGSSEPVKMIAQPFARGKLRLLDEATGEPISGLNVTYRIKAIQYDEDAPPVPPGGWRRTSAVSNEQGEVELPYMVAGLEYELRVSGERDVTLTVETVTAGNPGELVDFGTVRLTTPQEEPWMLLQRMQSLQNTVIPAQAGIQTKDDNPVSLDPRLRGGDEKNDLPIPQETVQITGRFVQESGQPIPNVTILARWDNRLNDIHAQSDNTGRFSLAVGKGGQQTVILAQHDDFVFKRLVATEQNDNRSEIPLGDIVLKSGFRPTIQVLDKEGKPVSDVWVSLNMVVSQEELETRASVGQTAVAVRPETDPFLFRTYEAREALTDANGRAIFGPVEAGNFLARIVDRPSMEGRLFRNGTNLSAVERANRYRALARPIKGVYESAAITFSPTSLTATIQAVESINVTVHYSGAATLGRTPAGSISGWHSFEFNRDFSGTEHSNYRNKSRDGNKLLFEVPARLWDATFSAHVILPGAPNREYNNELIYRCFIDGKEILAERRAWLYSFPLEPFDGDTDIQISVYKAPLITLHVVDETGKPILEYFAGAQYARRDAMPEVTWDADGVRLENVNRTSHTTSGRSSIHWTRLIDKHGHLYSGLDIEFGWRNFGVDTTRINADAILPDEELRLYVVAKGYDVAQQAIPKMAEGEERELTVVLKRR